MTDDEKSSGYQSWDDLSFKLVLQTLTLRHNGQHTQLSLGSATQIVPIVPSLNFLDEIIMEVVILTKRTRMLSACIYRMLVTKAKLY